VERRLRIPLLLGLTFSLLLDAGASGRSVPLALKHVTVIDVTGGPPKRDVLALVEKGRTQEELGRMLAQVESGAERAQ